jgi:hypothetical protein
VRFIWLLVAERCGYFLNPTTEFATAPSVTSAACGRTGAGSFTAFAFDATCETIDPVLQRKSDLSPQLRADAWFTNRGRAQQFSKEMSRAQRESVQV